MKGVRDMAAKRLQSSDWFETKFSKACTFYTGMSKSNYDYGLRSIHEPILFQPPTRFYTKHC